LPDVIEYFESRSIQTSGGRGTGSRVFHITGTTSVKDVYELIGREGDNGVRLPRPGEKHPDFPGLIARDFNIALVSGHTDLWRVEWTYEVISRGFASLPVTQPESLPAEVGYTEVSAEIRAEFILAWRKNGSATLKLPEQGTPNPAEDVRGDPCDAAGNPTSIQRDIQEFTFTETLNVPKWSTYRDFRFTRNAANFLGFPTGSVLYRGASVRRTGVDVFQVAHSFVEDSLLHLQQQPLIEFPDGTPKLDATGHAAFVYWIQPFPTLADHNTISENF